MTTRLGSLGEKFMCDNQYHQIYQILISSRVRCFMDILGGLVVQYTLCFSPLSHRRKHSGALHDSDGGCHSPAGGIVTVPSIPASGGGKFTRNTTIINPIEGGGCCGGYTSLLISPYFYFILSVSAKNVFCMQSSLGLGFLFRLTLGTCVRTSVS